MERLELAETVEALRAELARAASEGAGAAFQFPVDQVQLEFHVAHDRRHRSRDQSVRVWDLAAGNGVLRLDLLP